MPSHESVKVETQTESLQMGKGELVITDLYLWFYQDGYDIKIYKDQIKKIDIEYKKNK